MFRVVIPARYASTRLPGKPLRLDRRSPDASARARKRVASGADEVWIATDDASIEQRLPPLRNGPA